MSAFVTINILTFNRKEILHSLLVSLKNISYARLEIIVVDNCSGDGTCEMMSKEFPEVGYFRMEKNLGVAARNEGIKRAHGDIIVTIDDDILGLNDEYIAALINYFEHHHSVGALNFRVIDSVTGRICNWIHHREEEKYHTKDFLTYEITEGAVAFRREVFNAAGLYPDYFFLSHEGPDLAYRILDSGYEVRYAGIVTVLHSHANEGRKTWYRYYYDTRNQFFVAIRNFPFLYGARYLLKGIGSIFFYSVRDGFLKYWLKGVIDGFKGMIRYSCDRKVLSSDTMKLIHNIDKQRPSFFYMLKKRIFRKEMRL